MKYTIISGDSPESVANAVNNLLAQGWELYGSLCTTEKWPCQAMILSNETMNKRRIHRIRGDNEPEFEKGMPGSSF